MQRRITKVPSILYLAFVLAFFGLGWIKAFIIPKAQNDHFRRLKTEPSSSRERVAYEMKEDVLPQRQQRHRHQRLSTRILATVERDSTASGGESKNMGKGGQRVLFQKVIRPTKDMPDAFFLGYLIEYLERHFELPSDLPMVYENMVINDFDDDDDDDAIDSDRYNDDRYTLAWDSPLSPSVDATRMEVEVVGIYTDDDKTKKQSSSPTPSVPNMAMVVVRRPNTNNDDDKPKKVVPPMMKGLFDDCENRIIQTLDRGLDDFAAGRIKFEMNDDLAGERSKGKIPNVKNVMEAIEAELVDEEPKVEASEPKVAPEDVVFDAHATTESNKEGWNKDNDNGQKVPATNEKAPRSKQDIAEAKVRAMATMQNPVEESTKTQSDPKSATTSGVGFAVEAAAKQAARKNIQQLKQNAIQRQKKVLASKDDDSSTADASKIDFAIKAAQKASALQQEDRPQSAASEAKEDFAVAAARKRAADPTRKASTNKKVRGKKSLDNSSKVKGEPQMSEGPSMPPIPEGWKPKDYFRDQRAFMGTISRPETAAKRKSKQIEKTEIAKRQVLSKQASKVSAKIPLPSKHSEPALKTPDEKAIENRKVNAKLVDKNDIKDDALSEDPVLGQITSSNDGNTPSEKDIELEIMKAAKTALDEIEEQGFEMTPEEMLKDLLKFDEEKKKEETPGSGFASGALEEAKQLMKSRHRQIQERKKQELQQNEQQIQLGYKETSQDDPNSFPKHPNPIGASEAETKPKLTPEEELRQMFTAGQRIAEGKLTTSSAKKGNGIGSLLKSLESTEEEVDRLIAEEKSVSKYARVLDDELTELEVRINASPGEELDGPPKNPMFDVMSGPEVYDPNVDLDAVNYPGALPGTADIKLPKQLDEAIKQAEFAASVIMKMETNETKDEATGLWKEYYFSGGEELTTQQVENLKKVVKGAVKSGIIDDPVEVMAEASRLQLILDELWNQPEERFHEIASNYKDLLLSDRFVGLVKERMKAMEERDLDALRNDDESLRAPNAKEREILGRLVNYAQALLKETRALGAELEASQLEIVRSICKVAMDPEHTTEEETAKALSDAVRDIRPLLDDTFVAYLKYAVAEEEAKLARAGLLDDPDYNQWLFVLKIVQQGVYAEIAKGINRYIDHIWYVLRMETPRQRRQLLSDLIDDMPTLDVRPFVQVVDNIVGSLGDGVNGNFDELVPLGEMTNTLLQLQNDMRELLPPERINLKSKDADEWAARQRKRLMDQRELGKKRLEAANEAAGREQDVEAAFGQAGEIVDRFD